MQGLAEPAHVEDFHTLVEVEHQVVHEPLAVRAEHEDQHRRPAWLDSAAGRCAARIPACCAVLGGRSARRQGGHRSCTWTRSLMTIRYTSGAYGPALSRVISSGSLAGLARRSPARLYAWRLRGNSSGRSVAPRLGATAPACRTARSVVPGQPPALRRRPRRTRRDRTPAAPTGWRAARHPARAGARPAAAGRKRQRSRAPRYPPLRADTP